MLRAPAEMLYAEEIEALDRRGQARAAAGLEDVGPGRAHLHLRRQGGQAGHHAQVHRPSAAGRDRHLHARHRSRAAADRRTGHREEWLSEHLAAAINGDSTKVVQGTAGTTEEQIRYTWNYAMLIAHGPSHEALIKSPIFRAMESGTLARFEEITRCASEVQDAMISLLSEKRISVPELATEVPAQKGFSIIATANTRDRGVNDMSAALKRRFNIVVLPTPETLETEDRHRPQARPRAGQPTWNCGPSVPADDAHRKSRHHLPRAAHRADARRQEQAQDALRRALDGRGDLRAGQQHGAGRQLRQRRSDRRTISPPGLQGSVVKDEEKDHVVWQEYLTNVLKKRGAEWRPLFTACSEHNA